MFGNFELLLTGVPGIFVLQRVTRWLHRRGWIQWRMPGTSSALGNGVTGVQVFYQPLVREVLEARLDEQAEDEEPGDPPETGP